MHATFRIILAISVLFSAPKAILLAEDIADEGMDIGECVVDLKSPKELVFERANQCLYDAIPGNTVALIKVMEKNQEPIVRGRLALLFAKRNVQDAIPEIIKLTEDPNILVRRCAVSALHEMADVRAVPVLLKAMREDDFAIQADAVGGILKMKKDVSKRELAGVKDLLVLRARHPKKVVRENAVNSLGELAGADVIPLIEDLLKTDTFYYVSMQNIGGKVIEKKVFPIRAAAERAIKKIKARSSN